MNNFNNKTFEDISNNASCYKILPYMMEAWKLDPKHLVFQLARYKFVSKMLTGKLLEVGCGDGYGMPIVLETADSITGIDVVGSAIDNGIKYYSDKYNIEMYNMNIIKGVDLEFTNLFDGAYSLDVIEHIPAELEDDFIGNIVKTLKNTGALIIGTPNVTSSAYASESSLKEHINLYSHDRLKKLLQKYFNNVFMFSMNDEVLHVGFQPMSHYIFALAVFPT